MIKAGIIGATGYAGEEIIRILSGHKGVKIAHLSAVLDKEEPISDIFPSLKGLCDIVCRKPDTAKAIAETDLVFLALPHRVSMEAAPQFLKAAKKVIDLSADYRLEADVYKTWYGAEHKDKANISNAAYGLPELYADKIRKASLIANPGCYPTSVILAIAPALKEGIVKSDSLISDSKSGVTGAGRKADIALSFAEVNENVKAYKVNAHQHKPEIDKILSEFSGTKVDVIFTPHLIPMNRGILSTVYMRLSKSKTAGEIIELYKKFYKGKPFVRVKQEGSLPQTRDVIRTNYCDIGIVVKGDIFIAVSCIDNLEKGAAGQAVQNMNLMCGFEETEGLI